MEQKEAGKRTWQRGRRKRTLWSRIWDRTGLRGKTLWDCLQLLSTLAIPVVIALAGFYFEGQLDEHQRQSDARRAKVEREIEEQRAQDAAVQAYLDKMSTLLIEKDLRTAAPDSDVRALARAQTLAVLERLEPSRKIEPMQFLSDATLVQGLAPAVSLRRANLSGANLTDINLNEADLASANLSDADLSGALMSGADLYEADLSGADLSGADLSGADIFHAELRGANLSGANLSGANLHSDNLRSARNLREAKLAKADIFNTELSGANLSGADLSGAHFFSTELSSANLSGADLSGAHFSNTELSGTDLSGADLSGAHLINADLSGVTGWTEEQLTEAKYLDSATMPNGQKYEDWLLPAGKYGTHEFEPAFSLEFSAEWAVTGPETTDAAVFGAGLKGGQLILSNPRHVFAPSSNPREPIEDPAPKNADGWVSWFQRHPNLDTTKPGPVSLGDASGKQIDVMASSTRARGPGIPVYSRSELLNVGIIWPGWKYRFAIVDVGGDAVVIAVAAPGDKFDKFLRKAQKVLDTVEWKGG